jgi:hypothetical protein
MRSAQIRPGRCVAKHSGSWERLKDRCQSSPGGVVRGRSHPHGREGAIQPGAMRTRCAWRRVTCVMPSTAPTSRFNDKYREIWDRSATIDKCTGNRRNGSQSPTSIRTRRDQQEPAGGQTSRRSQDLERALESPAPHGSNTAIAGGCRVALITIRRRTAAWLAVPIATAAAVQVVGYRLLGLANAIAAQLVLRQLAAEPIRPDVALGLHFDYEDLLAIVTIVSPVFLILGLVSPLSFGAVSRSPYGGSEHPLYYRLAHALHGMGLIPHGILEVIQNVHLAEPAGSESSKLRAQLGQPERRGSAATIARAYQ